MAKTLLFSILAAACLALALPQDPTDGMGVTVSLNGAEILHREGVGYPPSAMRNGIQGTVSVEVKIGPTGEVSDAQVLTGPKELRKAVLESVLEWHFAQSLAGATRMVEVAFTTPKIPPLGSGTALPAIQPGTIRSIQVQGLSAEGRAGLLAVLPVHEGDQWNSDVAGEAMQAVKAYDEHLSIRQQAVSQSPSGAAQLDLVISTAPRIRVGGNVQSAMAIRKVPPVYPPDAKAARIQGSVHLSAIIGPDGAVQQVTVLGGPPELSQAAVDAVRQWVYKPTRLNGNPVQVETNIDVNFTLAN
ncbi:MAG TPA: energy transducer TonB [Bryobacteraceae bacterium]|nr:energy transducer TonB [Bryobacteraceae bacterium]